jgi:hypothetical protein
MKKSSLIVFLLIGIIFSYAQKPTVKQTQTKPAAPAEETIPGKFTGMLFNDFYYVIQEPQTAQPNKGTSGRFASAMRRATIGYQYSFSPNVSAKVVYDASANVLKQGYVDVRNVFSQVDLKVGMSQTVASETMDKIWQYRSLEANVLDRKGMTQEFDMGFTVTGRTDAQGTTYGRLAVYNGSGIAAENDKTKKIALALGNWFDKSSMVEVYVDYENFSSGRSAITGKAAYGMTMTTYGFGGEAFYRLNRKFAGTKDVNPVGASFFSWFDLMKALRGVARLDVMDNNMNADANTYREIYLNAGVDYMPVPDVHLMPNLVYVKNLKKGSGVEIVDYMMLRLTTSVYFK